MSYTNDILSFWEERARRYAYSSNATMPDDNLKHLEKRALLRHSAPGETVLDVGCGNGHTILFLASTLEARFFGVDFSRRMIEQARLLARRHAPRLRGELRFSVDDILHLSFPDETFDRVITERCLINLSSFEMQLRGVAEVHRVLKTGGTYLMMEQTQEGLSKINRLRGLLGLRAIVPAWHNLYIEERKCIEAIRGMFSLVGRENFSSSYYVGSKVIHNFLVKNPRYDGVINKISRALPAIGDWGYDVLFCLNKMSPRESRS